MIGLDAFAKATLLGVEMGMTLILITVGLTLIFGMMDVINFAHGSLYMLGAYFGFAAATELGSFWLALLVAPVAVALVGALVEVFTIRPLYGRNPLYHILLTFGLAIVVQGLVTEMWGGQVRNIETPALLSGTLDLGFLTYPTYRVFLLVTSTLVVFAFWVAITRSNFGVLMRASAHDSEMVDALGIDVAKVFTAVFVLGSALAGLAGVLLGAARAVDPSMGVGIIIQAFAIVVIGGLGSFRGAVVGALVVGLLNAYGPMFASSLTDTLIFVLMAVVLLIKPTGLYGQPEGS
ncbi:amino acid/amide ABC transporter membrane protein 1, HAAT family (TC 3.A.1.4.-) [Halogranum amylolyticum]|uniref:Amino acid/amide ABC transporter membrane protein 1, HAAT family (TC 3.A.1.4.-) n=1 Tax=Halogranum amylolyticum TaxID=660520 RepID=A0A1H8UBD6_9EURY|nr:branched-chain amino acid ABC transporter permease [Halogranum amylolyticum]SEP00416.1 amino acid/amide ABC transporter membrane protein 1, HAAT family (TC 3.A.1.4.-) [Halogranum amylolyticum]